MLYTTGNWTVKNLTTDTVPTEKNIPVADLSFASDYKRTKDEPKDAEMVNITSPCVISPEKVVYGRSIVKNVYADSGIDSANQFAQKEGIQVLAKVSFNLQATNGVSGQEVLMPMTSYVVLRTPSAPIITGEAVEYALKRAIANCFATGSNDESRIVDLVKGALLPVN